MPRLAASWWQLRCGWSYLDQLPKLQMPATVVAQSIILLIDNPPFRQQHHGSITDFAGTRARSE